MVSNGYVFSPHQTLSSRKAEVRSDSDRHNPGICCHSGTEELREGKREREATASNTAEIAFWVKGRVLTVTVSDLDKIPLFL